jgi:hypothetical protein
MVVESIPQTEGSPAVESFKTSYVSSPSKRKEKDEQIDSGTELERAVAQVDISEPGKELTNIESLLDQISDSELRRAAKEGLDKTVRYLAGQVDGSPMHQFLEYLKTLSTPSHSASVQEAFIRAGNPAFGKDQMAQWIESLKV